MAIVKDLGMVTAYAYAVAGGYEGTEAEFTEALGRAGIVVEQLENLTAVATTLSEGSEATASYANGVLTFGIPKGDTGATGPQGEQGVKGDTGNGIVSIAKTATVGKVDTYTITFTNGTTTTFEVTNGEVTPEQMQAAIEAALVDYAEADGTYPLMTAGMAQSLDTDDVVTDTKPYLYRQTGADAVREYNEIVGGSVVVNQLVDAALLSPTYAASGITFTNNGDGSITVTGTATTTTGIDVIFINNVPVGHKIMMSSGVSGGVWGQFVPLFNYNAATQAYAVPATILNNSNATVRLRSQVWVDNTVNFTIIPQIIDLTQMFGSAIADYAYTLEQSTAGSGVAWLKSYGFFADDYIPYNSGEFQHVSGLISHDMTGFNQWDEEWEVGGFYTGTGLPWDTTDRIRSKNYIPVMPNTSYYIAIPSGSNSYVFFYDENEAFITSLSRFNSLFTTPSNAKFLKFNTGASYGTTYKNNICININNPARNDEYEPYVKHSYPLDSDVVLRGIPKLSGDQMYYDGDVYSADGAVSRKYAIVDLGTLTWSKVSGQALFTAYITGMKDTGNAVCEKYPYSSTPNSPEDKSFFMGRPNNYSGRIVVHDESFSNAALFKTANNNVSLVYEKAETSTEQATPYQSPQICDPDGTEHYVGAAIPVGHNTKYPANLVGRLEKLPDIPTTAGTYNLQVTVASGKATAQWVSV